MSASQGELFVGTAATPHTDTLKVARRIVMSQRFNTYGVSCPCCDGLAKVYARGLHKTLALILIQMYVWDRRQPRKYRHVKNEWPKSAGTFTQEYSRMVDLDLIVKADTPEKRDGNPDNGFHRITELGRQFVEGRADIPAKQYLYKGTVIDQTTQRATIHDALGYHFEYMEPFS